MAAENMDNTVCAAMLERGANPNVAAEDNWTPLFVAADTGNVELARALLAKGADTNARQGDGWSVFHMAVKKNSRAVLDVLLEKKPDGLLVVTKSGRTLLHQASKEGFTDLVKLLLAKGRIDINAIDTENGKTALGLRKSERKQGNHRGAGSRRRKIAMSEA